MGQLASRAHSRATVTERGEARRFLSHHDYDPYEDGLADAGYDDVDQGHAIMSDGACGAGGVSTVTFKDLRAPPSYTIPTTKGGADTRGEFCATQLRSVRTFASDSYFTTNYEVLGVDGTWWRYAHKSIELMPTPFMQRLVFYQESGAPLLTIESAMAQRSHHVTTYIYYYHGGMVVEVATVAKKDVFAWGAVSMALDETPLKVCEATNLLMDGERGGTLETAKACVASFLDKFAEKDVGGGACESDGEEMD